MGKICIIIIFNGIIFTKICQYKYNYFLKTDAATFNAFDIKCVGWSTKIYHTVVLFWKEAQRKMFN